ncbi:MAG: hypothetical protein ACTHNW_20080 [Mucilaginibacter sp.]
MKNIFLLCFLFCSVASYSQTSKLAGKYRSYFGRKIEIRDDSTFYFSWHFDLESSWSQGKWTVRNDTVYFKTVSVYDTLRYKNNNGHIVDSLILSETSTPKVITSPIVSQVLSGFGQNRYPCPNMLFYKNGKLFSIDKNGNLIKKKIRGLGSKKKWIPWYFKDQ